MSLRRVYETTIIINAALEDVDIDTVISKFITFLENHGGVIEETNKWGRRRLAYNINKKYNGYYVHLIFNVPPSVVPLLERFLVLEDTILRHLTLQLPSELREYRKQKSLAQGKSGETIISSVSEIDKVELVLSDDISIIDDIVIEDDEDDDNDLPKTETLTENNAEV